MAKRLFIAWRDLDHKNDRDDGIIYPDANVKTLFEARRMPQGTKVSDGVCDTGSTDFLIDTSFDECIKNPSPSQDTYATAGGGTKKGELTGEADMIFLNWWEPKATPWQRIKDLTVTSMRDQDEPLASPEELYKNHGYDLHLCHGYKPTDFTGFDRPAGAGRRLAGWSADVEPRPAWVQSCWTCP